ncbi:MAG TPA: BLUF domain-containing protein [Hymenobacter sp.]|jgi:CheY-like chemotaxis protein|uniref:BLUF domain-containing protein n=1 Tax=Hymenobacter sp. TaxID=1898978 RepID=UPI002ED88CA7
MRKLPGILLVDDDATSAFLTQRLLHKLAVADQVVAAPNGTEGLRVLQHLLAPPAPAHAAPWLVLLDLHMPVLDGFGFLEACRRLPAAQRQRMAMVVLTTSLHGADLERLQGLPISGLVPKPLTEAKVRAILRGNLPVPALPGPDPAAGVFQLLYHSRATQPLAEAEVYELLSQSRQANAAAQITGVLVYRDEWFVQLLEGPEAAVRATYARIRQDPRHTEVVTLAEAPARPRCFVPWRMALGRNTTPNVARLFAAVLSSPAGDEEGGARIEALLQAACGALEDEADG